MKRIYGIYRKDYDQELEGGFTLIELLIVVTILGVLAAIAIISASALTGSGQKAACITDTDTIQVAQEANFASEKSYGGTYTDMSTLVARGFLSKTSTTHFIRSVDGAGVVATTSTPSMANYAIVSLDHGGAATEASKCNEVATDTPGGAAKGVVVSTVAATVEDTTAF